MSLAKVRIQKPEVVVNFSGSRDGRTGVRAAGALLDRDCGRQSLYIINVRFLQLVQELAGVRGKRFDVLPLAFGEKGIEGEGRLPRTARTGKNHQLVPRNIEGEVLEIVLPRPNNADHVLCHFNDETTTGDTGAKESP